MGKEKEILKELNLLSSELEDHGDIMVEMLLEAREDEGLPPPDEDEMADIKSYVKCNDAIYRACLDRIDFLHHRYRDMTVSFPREINGRYFPVLTNW